MIGVMGYSPLEAGLRTLRWTAAPMVVAPIAGLLAPRVGLRALLLLGQVLQTGALVWLAVATEAGSAYGALVPAFVMAGVGMGLTFAPSATAPPDGNRQPGSPKPTGMIFQSGPSSRCSSSLSARPRA